MIKLLDSENADLDISSQVTVLTHTPNASEPMLCQGVVKLGDGTKDLDGSGGAFELTLEVGGQTIQPNVQSITFGTEVRSMVMTMNFAVPANDQVIMKLKSPNAGDSDVDVTAYLYQTDAVDMIAISGDSTAADNLEATYDGTGYTDPVAPSQQQQLDNIANTGAATNKEPDANSTLTTGSTLSGSYADCAALDLVYWIINDAAGSLDMYFEFDVGATGVPVSAKWTGYLQGSNDSLSVQAYNWDGASWDSVGAIVGTNPATVQVESFDLLTRHVGSGSNAGKVRVRFQDTGLSTATFATDQILCAYSTVASPVGYANGAIWVDTLNGTAGAVKGVNGVADLPVDNWADAVTLSGLTGLNRFQIGNGSAITLSGNSDNYSLIGANWTLDLNGQSIANAVFDGASVTGTAASSGASYEMFNCLLADGATLTVPPGFFLGCGISGDIVVNAVGTFYFDQCFSGVAGTATPSIDFGAAIADTNINFRHYSGGIEIKNMGQLGTDNMSLEGWGQYVLNANCVGGTLAIRGNFDKTDNSGGAVTLSEDANYKGTTLVSGVLQDGGANWVQLDTPASSIDGAYDPAEIIVETSSGTEETRAILEYDGATKKAYIGRDFKQTPSSGDGYRIIASSGRGTTNEGLAQGGGVATITLNTLASSTDNIYNCQVVKLLGSTGADQSGIVIAYDGTTKIATVHKDWATQPDNTTTYEISSDALPGCVVDLIKDVLLNKDVQTRHANDVPSQYLAGTGSNQETVDTTIDGSGNVETEVQA